MCTNCAHYKAGKCFNAKLALLSRTHSVSEIGRDFATIPQHCIGFAEKKQEQKR